MAASVDLVTTAEVKTYLGIADATHDTLIGELIDLVSEEVEDYCRTHFSATAVTETLDGGTEYLTMDRLPLISITSITDNTDSTVVTATNYDFYPERGQIYLKQDITVFPDFSGFWGPGRRRYTVVTSTGYTAVPEAIKLVAYSWIERHLKSLPTSNAKGRWTQPNFQEAKGDQEFLDLMGMGFTKEERRILDRYRNIYV